MMKKSKVLTLVFMAVVVISFCAVSNANAAGWYVCNVGPVGAGGGYSYAWLSDVNGAFTSTQFVLDPASEKQMLATVLTAKSNDQKVMVYLTGTSTGSIATVLVIVD